MYPNYKKFSNKFSEIEFLFHPAEYHTSTDELYFSRKSRDYCMHPNRKKELTNLLSKDLFRLSHKKQNVCSNKKILIENVNNKVVCIFDEEEFFHPKLLYQVNK